MIFIISSWMSLKTYVVSLKGHFCHLAPLRKGQEGCPHSLLSSVPEDL